MCLLHVQSLGWIRLFATLWTVAHQAPLSMEFSRQEYWSGCHFLLQGIIWSQGLNPSLLHWQVDFLPLSHLGSTHMCLLGFKKFFLSLVFYFIAVVSGFFPIICSSCFLLLSFKASETFCILIWYIYLKTKLIVFFSIDSLVISSM